MAWPVRAVQPGLPRRSASKRPWLGADNGLYVGYVLGGQSLSGLARPFFYAGARSLLVSHWAVASQPTVVLTTSHFEAYTRDAGLGRAAALCTAQARLLNDQVALHPAIWAPFVLVEDGGTP
jgi:CHAT domain-containing protein